MPDGFSEHASRAPKRRIKPSEHGYFYPGEVVRILGLEHLDYHQLRQLLRLVRAPSQAPGRAWARFDLKDLASVRKAFELAGGHRTTSHGRSMRLEFRALRRACIALRGAGYANPLLEVPLFRHGTRIVARLNGVVFDPATGQLELGSLMKDASEFARTHRSNDFHLDLRPHLAAENAAIIKRGRLARRAEAGETLESFHGVG